MDNVVFFLLGGIIFIWANEGLDVYSLFILDELCVVVVYFYVSIFIKDVCDVFSFIIILF